MTETQKPNNELWRAFLAAQRAFYTIEKDSSAQGRGYTSHESIILDGSRCLNDNGLIVFISLLRVHTEDASRAGGYSGHLSFEATLVHAETGASLVIPYAGIPYITHKGMADDKAAMAAGSYALIYFYRNTLMIARGLQEPTPVDARDDRPPAPQAPQEPAQSPPPPQEVQEIVDRQTKLSREHKAYVKRWKALFPQLSTTQANLITRGQKPKGLAVLQKWVHEAERVLSGAQPAEPAQQLGQEG